MNLPREHVGYYDKPGQTEPVYAPPFPVPCPVCAEPVTDENVRTVSVMYSEPPRTLSLFYRAHRACIDAQTPEEQSELDTLALGAWAS